MGSSAMRFDFVMDYTLVSQHLDQGVYVWGSLCNGERSISKDRFGWDKRESILREEESRIRDFPI